ncbi:TonB-dependent receptor [Zunongwangia sp. F260]|uniref:TonB-dependent receptor n=1 Tax=Autumnicola lenta TaxID=3075593 RepID=A0ABU3CNR7_9FLAO|nr:TonB-dependent receptor [Zunongwangia sp. F260]MDT0647999.1 TonB-dependent receptor [Zunongwangia sp. F260]
MTGTVVGDDGLLMPGVNVLIQGTNVGTQTNFDGEYELQAAPGDVLVFSFVGSENVEVVVGAEDIYDVVMQESADELNEVVVIGFGSKLKRDLTGSISSVDAEQIEKTAFASPQFALQGNTTGVRVINSSGDPNSPPEIYVRGIGSWQGNSQPLYVVDGQIITPPTAGNLDLIGRGGSTPPPNLFTMINPDDIASITVLKDASSAAIYGSRGANGVVLITTKKGKRGAPTVEFTSRAGFQNIDTFNMLNTEQYRNLVEEMYANNNNPDVSIEEDLYGRLAADDIVRRISFSPQFDPTSPFYISSNETYDWQDDLVRNNALINSYGLKVSGADKNTDYYVGIGYDNQEGVLVGSGLETYRASINLNTRINDWLKIGMNYKFAHQNSEIEDTPLDEIAAVTPWQPIYDPSSDSGFAEVLDPPAGNWQQVRRFGQGTKRNYLANASINRGLFQNLRHIGQGYVELTPLRDLTLRTSLSLDQVQQDRVSTRLYSTNIFRPDGQDPRTDSPAAPNSLGTHESRANNIFNYQFDFTLTYEKNFGDHRFVFTGVVQDQYQRTQTKNLSGGNIININNIDQIGFDNDLANNSSFVSWNERFWFGYVGRLSYSYGDKYYLDGSFRRDASSGMAEEYRWGNFYSLSGAWRLSSERFMNDVDFVNDFKLRAGYGEAGNDEVAVGRFAYLSRAGGAGSYRFGSGNGDALGNYFIAVNLNDFPNEALVWEVAETTYVGFDAAFFDYRLNMTMELYQRRQNGIQQIVNLPLSVGTSDPLFNVGELLNEGVDLSLGYNDKIGDFSYGATANISFLRNEVTQLYNNQPLFSTNQFGRTYRVEEGRSLGHIWGYKVGGIFQSQQEIDEYYNTNPDQTVQNMDYVAPGDLYFQDVQGDPTEEEPFYSTTPDGQVNTYDQTEIGNTIPGYTYGININSGYKGFDLSLSFYGEGDVDKYNYVRAAQEAMSSSGVNYRTTVQNRWTPTNTDTNMPRAVIGDPAGNNRFSDRFVESAAFFRLNNWQLGYTLQSGALASMKDAISSLRIYVGGQNNIYVHNWRGIDPVNDAYPLPKTYMLGLKANF